MVNKSILDFMKLLDWLLEKLGLSKTEPIKEFRPVPTICSFCKKTFPSNELFECYTCNEFFCDPHNSHRVHEEVPDFEGEVKFQISTDLDERETEQKVSPNFRKIDEPEIVEKEVEEIIIGNCFKCKKELNQLNTRCIKCGKLLCSTHLFKHKCIPIKTEGLKEPKLGDKNINSKDLQSISKAKHKLLEYAVLDREIAGLIHEDGTIDRIQVGDHASVEPNFHYSDQTPGVIFHTHPNNDHRVSGADHRHIEFLAANGAKVKAIVVTRRGFTSYGTNPGTMMYGWNEV